MSRISQELYEKMLREEELSPAEHLALEEALAADSAWSDFVHDAAPRPEPSMAWRSELNVRLAEMRRPVRRSWLNWRMGAGLAAMAACGAGLAMFVFAPTSNASVQPAAEAPAPAGSLESAIAAAHRDTQRQADLGVYIPAQPTLAAYNWDELGAQ